MHSNILFIILVAAYIGNKNTPTLDVTSVQGLASFL